MEPCHNTQERTGSVSLFSSHEGSVYVEYLVVLCMVSIGAAFAIAACGILLLNLLHYQQAVILFPLP